MTLEPLPPLQAPTPPKEPFFVAMVIDGVVFEVLNIDGSSAARFLAQPTFVQVSQTQCASGWTYDGTTFTPPVAPSA